MPHQALCQIKIFAPFGGFLLCSHLSTSFFVGFCGGEGEFFARRQKRGDVRERPLCGMQRALRMCPVLGCAETASLPVANIAASQNASKTRFAMRDAKTATGKRRRFLQKAPPPPQASPSRDLYDEVRGEAAAPMFLAINKRIAPFIFKIHLYKQIKLAVPQEKAFS
ncbi:MAG: hypothetical protein J6L87_03645 [Clostridia bacterium]|nr:hypothetical protein [Clostridia bacterium]